MIDGNLSEGVFTLLCKNICPKRKGMEEGPLDLKTARWKCHLNKTVQVPQNTSSWWTVLHKCHGTPWIMAIVVTIVICVLLACLKPPFILQKTEDPLERGQVSLGKLLFWSILAGILCCALPCISRSM